MDVSYRLLEGTVGTTYNKKEKKCMLTKYCLDEDIDDTKAAGSLYGFDRLQMDALVCVAEVQLMLPSLNPLE